MTLFARLIWNVRKSNRQNLSNNLTLMKHLIVCIALQDRKREWKKNGTVDCGKKEWWCSTLEHLWVYCVWQGLAKTRWSKNKHKSKFIIMLIGPVFPFYTLSQSCCITQGIESAKKTTKEEQKKHRRMILLCKVTAAAAAVQQEIEMNVIAFAF